MMRITCAVIIYALVFSPSSYASATQPSFSKVLRDIDREICRSFRVKCQRAEPRTKKARRVAGATSSKVSKAGAKPHPLQSKKMSPVSPHTVKETLSEPIGPPLPPPKPLLKVTPASIVLLPRPKPQKPAPFKNPGLEPVPKDVTGGCLQQLHAQGAGFIVVKVLSDRVATGVVNNGVCHVQDPVRLEYTRAQDHLIRLPEAPLLNCKYALQLSKWLAESAAPLVAAQSSTSIEKVSTGPGYDCRGRNGDTFAKISEHGHGNAVDISTFSMEDGTVIRVADAQNPNSLSYATLRKLRTSACGYFTTVLGPGTNAAHATHFHFDLGVHGKSGAYHICE